MLSLSLSLSLSFPQMGESMHSHTFQTLLPNLALSNLFHSLFILQLLTVTVLVHIYLSTCMSFIYQSVCLLSVCLSVLSQLICLSVLSLFICLSILYLSTCLSYRSIYLLVLYLSTCLSSIQLSIYLSLSHCLPHPHPHLLSSQRLNSLCGYLSIGWSVIHYHWRIEIQHPKLAAIFRAHFGRNSSKWLLTL